MDTNTFLQQEFIRNRLHDHTGWIAKYNKIKTSFSSNILEILKGPINQHEQQKVTVSYDLAILIDNKHLEPRNLKLKLIPNILQDRKKDVH